MKALGRYAAWQVWERTVRRPWTVELHDGIRIRCYPHSPVTSAVIYRRLADYQEMRFLLDFLRPGDTFVDVGANVGVYSLLACSVPGVGVAAFEPSSATFEKALENIRLNALEDRVNLVRKAVGSAEKDALVTTGRASMNSLVESGSGTETEAVEVTTLDAALRGREAVTLVKIDVEGWEAEVLEGAADLLRTQKPALLVEVNDVEGLEEIRQRYGYRCVRYLPADRRLVAANLAGSKGFNAILVPDIDAAALRVGPERGDPPPLPRP